MFSYLHKAALTIYGYYIFRKKIRVHGLFVVGNRRNVRVGRNLAINYGVYIQGHNSVCIGYNVVLSPHSMILDSGLKFSDITNKKERKQHIEETINIGNNVWIGAGAIILPGVSLGDNSVVGAGSVVTKSVPSYSLVVGNPAKVLRKIDAW